MNNNIEPCWLSTEKSAFNELKKSITEEWGPDAADDDRIWRFLKARDFNVENSKIMLKNNLAWRKANGLDTILQDFTMSEVFEKYYPLDPIGLDKRGYPVYVISIGNLDIKGFLKSLTNKQVVRHIIYNLEALSKQTVEMSKKLNKKAIDKWIFIADIEGVSWTQASSKRVIEQLMELVFIYEAHFPEKVKTIYFINVAFYFYVIFNITKKFISPVTLEKIKFFGKDGWSEELLQHIDPEILPGYLGGKKTDPDGNPMCHSFIRHGTPIPEKYYIKNANSRHLRKEPGIKYHALKNGKTLDINLLVLVADSFIEWDIETEDYDIAFGLFYNDIESAQENQRSPLIPVQRVNAHMLCETGTFKCSKPGIYILTLDNSYSIFRTKKIFYKVSVIRPDETKFGAISNPQNISD